MQVLAKVTDRIADTSHHSKLWAVLGANYGILYLGSEGLFGKSSLIFQLGLHPLKLHLEFLLDFFSCQSSFIVLLVLQPDSLQFELPELLLRCFKCFYFSLKICKFGNTSSHFSFLFISGLFNDCFFLQAILLFLSLQLLLKYNPIFVFFLIA